MSGAAPTTVHPHADVRAERNDSTEMLRFLDAMLTRAARTDRLLAITLPAPMTEPLALRSLAPNEAFALWEPPVGDRFLGLGESASIRHEGPSRFSAVREWASSLAARTEHVAYPDQNGARKQPEMPLRFLGGFSFEPGQARDERWSRFGDASFVVPRWLYVRSADHATLTLYVEGAEARAGTPYLDSAARALAVLEAAARAGKAFDGHGKVLRIEHLSDSDWSSLVGGAFDAMRSGDLDKVVVARRSLVSSPERFVPETILGRLRNAYPECFTFAISRGDITFLGATPERLVSKLGTRVMTEALAGSMAVSGDRAPERLCANGKELGEHEFVVRHIVERLEPRCVELSYPAEPAVRALANVLHLLTPITGTLSKPEHVLDLVELLHPTPAVGGVPSERAVDWIARHEPAPRGWYAGPVGWFGSDGDGEFAVALRSGLVSGREAWVYAGAGIVRDSDPDAEYEETSLKLGAVLGALGTSP